MLLVAWQEPDSRRVFPVARVRLLPGGAYELAYVRAVTEARAHGFPGLPGFSDVEQVYVTPEWPAFLEHRVARARPHVDEAGMAQGRQQLDPSPVLLAVPLGGGASMRLEVFAPPLPARGGRAWGVFSVRGVGRVPGSEAAVERLELHERLVLRREPENAYNPHALLIVRGDRSVLGYVPDYMANEMAAAGCGPSDLQLEAWRKQRLNFPPSPPIYQVLCRYTCSSELGRTLFRSGMYAPLRACAND